MLDLFCRTTQRRSRWDLPYAFALKVSALLGIHRLHDLLLASRVFTLSKRKRVIPLPGSNLHRDRTRSLRLPFQLLSSPNPFGEARHPG
jgi:hypothetical protein